MASVQLGLPSINNTVSAETYKAKDGSKSITMFDSFAGRGEPGAQVYIRIGMVIARWIPVNEHGEWKTSFGREPVDGEHFEIEFYQAKAGYADSKRAIYGLANERRGGTKLADRFERIPVFLRIK